MSSASTTYRLQREREVYKVAEGKEMYIKARNYPIEKFWSIIN
jgi:hypothetical protein